MTQAQLHRAVARATGESIRTIHRIGFSLLADDGEDREPLVVDWDALDAERYSVFPQRSPQAVPA
jgi:hypothetical protein